MKASELLKIERVQIPEYPDLIIKIRKNLSWYDQIEITKIKDAEERARCFIRMAITEWNLEGDDGKILPLTKENVEKHLIPELIIPIMNSINKARGEKDVKKKS